MGVINYSLVGHLFFATNKSSTHTWGFYPNMGLNEKNNNTKNNDIDEDDFIPYTEYLTSNKKMY